jgi:AraC family transcriptional regulator
MKKSLINVDHRQEGSLQRILSTEPKLSINSPNWENIKFGYHEQQGFDTLEHTFQQHGFLIIHKFDGQVQRRLADEVRDEFVKSGDVIFCSAGAPHSISWEGEAHYSILSIEPEYFENMAFGFGAVNPGRIEPLSHFAQHDPIVYGVGDGLRLGLQCQQSFSRLYLDSISLLFARHIFEEKCTIKHQLTEKVDSFSYHQRQIIAEYIELQLNRDLCLEELSELVLMSRTRFFKLFGNTFGMPPCQYLIKQRIERAKYLLKRTKLEICQIAEMTGFNSHSHFTSTFRRHVFVTPEQYRQML